MIFSRNGERCLLFRRKSFPISPSWTFLFFIFAFLFLFTSSSFTAQAYAAYGAASHTGIRISLIHVNYNGKHGAPLRLAYDAANGFVYVSDFGYECPPSGCGGTPDRSRVVVINSSSNSVIAKIPVGYGASEIIYDPSNKEVYVINTLNNTISVIQNLSVVRNIRIGEGNCNINDGCGGYMDLIYNPSNGLVYASNPCQWCNNYSARIYAISSSTNKIIASIKVGSFSYAFWYDPSNKEVYVAGSADVYVIRGTTMIANVRVGTQTYSPSAFAYDPKNKDMYVLWGNVSVIDSRTNKVVANISLPPCSARNCYGRTILGEVIAYNPDNEHMYVGGTNMVDHAYIYAISSTSNNITSTINVSHILNSYPDIGTMNYDKSNNDMYFAISNDYDNYGYVAILNASNRVIAVKSSELVYQMVHNPLNGEMYGTCFYGNVVEVISS